MDKHKKKVVKTVLYSQINKHIDIYSSELRELITVSHFDIDVRYYAMLGYITAFAELKALDQNGYSEAQKMLNTWMTEQYVLYGLIVEDVPE